MGARGGKDSVYSGAKIGGSLAKIKASVALGTRLGPKDQNWGLWGQYWEIWGQDWWLWGQN